MINLGNDSQEKILGEGTYGRVTICEDDPTLAKKQLKVSCELIQEAAMLLYLKKLPNILVIENVDIPNKSIIFDRWDSSLRECIYKYRITYKQKLSIFKDILIGLCGLHELGIIHGDLKMSNILVNYYPDEIEENIFKACICDVGLTSLSKYAKIGRTADAYRPNRLVRHYSHDMFGLCVSMCRLFGNINVMGGKMEKDLVDGRDTREIRQLITNCNEFPNNKIKVVLLSLVPENPENCVTARKILKKIYNFTIDIETPNFIIYDITVSNETIKHVENTLIGLCKTYGINRNLRCLAVTINHLNSPGFKSDINLYILSSLIIFSSLFGGKKRFDTASAIEVSRLKYRRNQIHDTTTKLLFSENYMNHMMALIIAEK